MSANQRRRPPPRLHRPTPQLSKLSIGGKGGGGAGGGGKNDEEESYDLVSGNSLEFGMIIRLPPNLQDAIKQLEEGGGGGGGVARVKFDSKPNNPDGNVIDICGKEFRFTWSRERGDLCDIYEERRSGENRDGLLVESGCAWRKLNVERVLDESTKNYVKMRSMEADRQLKSCKTIILNNGSSSVNNHKKALATASIEGRSVPKLKKDPPFRRRNVGPTQESGGPSRPVLTPGLSSTTTVEGRLSVSPVMSLNEESRPSTSPFGVVNLLKGQEISNPEVEVHTRVVHAAEPAQQEKRLNAPPLNLRDRLISLLVENPSGLNFKALQKAVGEPTNKIKPVIGKIATYHAPGRYILKEGLELERFKKPSSDNGSYSECIPNHGGLKTGAKDLYGNIVLGLPVGDIPKKLPEKLSRQLEVSNLVEKIDTKHHSHTLVDDKKVSEHSEEHAGSSSDSESDSGSDSESDSGSDSESGSESSSDSDSAGSLGSKEGSDVDVNITSSDDEMDHAQKHEPGICTSPLPSKTEDQNKLNGATKIKQTSQVSSADCAVGIFNELLNDDNGSEFVDITGCTPLNANVRSSQEITPISPHHNNHQGESPQFFAGSLVNKGNEANDVFGLELYNPKTLPGSMLGSGTNCLDESSESAKKLGGCAVPPLISGGNRNTMLAHSSTHEPSKDQTLQAMDIDGEITADQVSERGVTFTANGSHLDALQSSRRLAEIKTVNVPDMMEGPEKTVQNPGYGRKAFGIPSSQDVSDGSARSVWDKYSMTKDGYAYEKSLTVKHGVIGDKISVPPKSLYRKQGVQVGKLIDAAQRTESHLEASPKDNSKIDANRPSVIDGGGNLLKRKLLNSESCKLLESTYGADYKGGEKKFEKYLLKASESISSASDHLNSDTNPERVAEKFVRESKQLKPDYGVGISGNLEGTHWKGNVVDAFEKSMRPHQGTVYTDGHQNPRAENAEAEVRNQLNTQTNRSTNFRKNVTSKIQGMGPKGYEGTSTKASVNATQQNGADNKVQELSPDIMKQNKPQKSNVDALWMARSNDSQKRRKVLSEEDKYAYLKYNKNEPELRGSIKDFSQYKEYVEEYREKYDGYCSLHKQLNVYRNEFSKLGQDLQVAKARDMEEYNKILKKLIENYCQCGTSYKKMKKIFIVLHEELKCLKKRIKDFAVSKTKGRISL